VTRERDPETRKLIVGREISLSDPANGPPILHFPASLRSAGLVAGTADGLALELRASIEDALERAPAPRIALVRGLEACARHAEGVVFAIEEPELFLAPQGHRYLYRLVHRLAERENQVFFTTHSPGLLNVAALDEVNLVARDALGVTGSSASSDRRRRHLPRPVRVRRRTGRALLLARSDSRGGHDGEDDASVRLPRPRP
jgi:hypothetical protein